MCVCMGLRSRVEKLSGGKSVCVYVCICGVGLLFFFSQCNYLGRPTEERITEVVKWGRWLFARDASVAS